MLLLDVVIHEASLEADHAQPVCVVMLKLPVPPLEEKDADGGEME